TGQSLPNATRAPCLRTAPIRYCQLARSWPTKGTVRSVFWSSSHAHSGWKLATTPRLANRSRSGGPVNCRGAGWGRPAGSALGGQRRQRVERDRDRAVPDGVEVHLEAESGKLARGFAQLVRVDEQAARMVRRVAVAVQVRRAHRGGERLAYPVEHQLDRGGAEVARAIACCLPAALQVRELAQATEPVPPQR